MTYTNRVPTDIITHTHIDHPHMQVTHTHTHTITHHHTHTPDNCVLCIISSCPITGPHLHYVIEVQSLHGPMNHVLSVIMTTYNEEASPDRKQVNR